MCVILLTLAGSFEFQHHQAGSILSQGSPRMPFDSTATSLPTSKGRLYQDPVVSVLDASFPPFPLDWFWETHLPHQKQHHSEDLELSQSTLWVSMGVDVLEQISTSDNHNLTVNFMSNLWETPHSVLWGLPSHCLYQEDKILSGDLHVYVQSSGLELLTPLSKG